MISKSISSFQQASWSGNRPRSSFDPHRSTSRSIKYRPDFQFGYRKLLWRSVTPNLFRDRMNEFFISTTGSVHVCTKTSNGIVYPATSARVGSGLVSHYAPAGAHARAPQRGRCAHASRTPCALTATMKWTARR